MTASAVAAARAVIQRLAHDAAAATSSAPMTTSAVAAARAVISRLAHNAAAATSLPPMSASAVAAPRSVIRGLAHNAAVATSSPPSSSSAFPSAKPFSSVTATPTPPPPPTATDLSPRSVLFLINLLNGLVLTNEEELIFRKAFNEKFCHFKVADILNHLEREEFTVEECIFLLKMIHSKLGKNKGLAELLSQEDMNLSCTNDEIMNNPMLARVEAKVDVLTKKVTEGNAEILKCVKVSNKSEWGTIEVLGKKLDLTKLEFLKKLVGYIMGM